jgi:hypothetical protein
MLVVLPEWEFGLDWKRNQHGEAEHPDFRTLLRVTGSDRAYAGDDEGEHPPRNEQGYEISHEGEHGRIVLPNWWARQVLDLVGYPSGAVFAGLEG